MNLFTTNELEVENVDKQTTDDISNIGIALMNYIKC